VITSVGPAGAHEQRRRHVEAQRLCRLEVEDRFVLGRHLHRQVGRLCTAQDAVDVCCRLSKYVDDINPVGHKSAIHDEVAPSVNRRQVVFGRERDNEIAMSNSEAVRQYEQAAVVVACERTD
jgi:hypothetical protein